MHVSQINNVNFQAGTVKLMNFSKDKLYSYEAINKLAQEKDLYISINKAKNSKFLPSEMMFTVLSSNNKGKYKHSLSCAIINKKANAEEVSVRIFNAVMNSIENLEKKLALK